jgi:hypothetical protein
MQFKAMMLGVCLAAFALPASANGVISEFRAGGVMFKETSTISIAREDLYLSAREIRVHYTYRSDAEATEHVTIGFPMPPVPLSDDPDYLGGVAPEDLADPSNYLNFTVKVNGAPVATTLHQYAYLNGFNVTEELKGAGMPLLVTVETRGAAIGALDEAARTRLVEQGFFTGTDQEFEFWQPMWSYQTVYEWEQDFAPGETEVDISYVPLNGYPSDIGTIYEGEVPEDAQPLQNSAALDYCIDDELKAAIKKRKDAGQSYEVVTQGYVVKTAQYWHNSIEEFTLTVDKADPALGEPFALVAFCPPGAEKISATAFRWSASNFWADRDIAVIYYHFYDIPQ